MAKGRLIVISGFSGAGKGTVVKRDSIELFKGIGRMIKMCFAMRRLDTSEWSE